MKIRLPYSTNPVIEWKWKIRTAVNNKNGKSETPQNIVGMVLFESLAVLGGLKDVFIYNRDLYMFNKDINQQRILQTQKMRVEQVLLFREDLRDLFDLTIGKMDNYLVVNTLTLAFSMAFFYEGRMPHDTPTWLFWLWGMSLATAVLFLMMSVWFAIHATITAQTFAVRLLTQWLRLPFPSQDDVVRATATAAEFEKQPTGALLRVPMVAKESQSSMAAKAAASSSTSNSQSTIPPESAEEESYPKMVNPALEKLLKKEYTTFVEHFHLFQYLQENFAGYDAYARVCMVVGTTQLLSVIGYMGVAWYVSDDSRWGGVVFTIMMVVFGIIHARMNLLLSKKEYVALCSFMILGPAAGTSAALFYYVDKNGLYSSLIAWLTPTAFLFHLLATAFFIAVGSETNGALPTKFSTIVSIDILGLWDQGLVEDEEEAPNDARAVARAAISNAVTGWQKRWLKATTREAPVSVLIPPSIDVTRAERERHLRPSLVENMNRAETQRSVIGGLETDKDAVVLPKSTRHMPTLPWVAFRQAGALVILLWLVAVGVGITVALIGDLPGWDSSPDTHQTAVGVALWAPGNTTSLVATSVKSSSLPFTSLLSTASFQKSKSTSSPQVSLDRLEGVSTEGVHFSSRQGRFVLHSNKTLLDYSQFESMAQFSELTHPAPSGRVPWCGAHDTVVLVRGEFRDCNALATRWSMEDAPQQEVYPFQAVAGRYALHSGDHHVYKFQLVRRGRSIRVEERIHLPVSLVGHELIDLSKNEFLLACLASSGLVAVWTTQHEEIPSKGVRVLPQADRVRWLQIAGAGGKAFVVFGEDKHTGLRDAWYIADILKLPKLMHR